MTAAITTGPIPDLDGFDTFYGVRISCIGEDGDMIMLGHVDDRHAIAVVRAYLRRLQGPVDADEYLNDRLARDPDDLRHAIERGYVDVFRPVARTYAREIKHCDRFPQCQGPDVDCGPPVSCAELDGCAWWLDTDTHPAMAGAFPASYWTYEV